LTSTPRQSRSSDQDQSPRTLPNRQPCESLLGIELDEFEQASSDHEAGLQTGEQAEGQAGEETRDAQENSTYDPIDTPEGFTPLDYLPTILKPVSTISMAVIYLGVICGILALMLLGDVNASYQVSNVNIYFAARWVPSLLGSLS